MNRDSWYHYIIGGSLCFLLYFFISIVLSNYLPVLTPSNAYIYFSGISSFNAALIVSIFLIYKYYHNISLKFLFSDSGIFNYKRAFIGFTIWGTLQVIQLIVLKVRSPETLVFNLQPLNFSLFLLLSLVLVPIQIISEELLFRGYLLKVISKILKNKILVIIVISTLFALPHLKNPEVTNKLLFFAVYFTMAALLTYLATTYKGLEYSIGIHLANNLFIINILNYPDTPLPSYPIFLGKDPILPLESLIENVIFSLLIVIIIKKIEKRINK